MRKYKYKGFIPQSVAPKDAVKIGLYDSNGTRIGTIPLGNLAPVKKTPLYKVGIVSDLHFAHTTGVAWNPAGKFDKALTYFESEGCAFVANPGDMSQTGFYRESAPDTFDDTQLAAYKQVCDAHDIEVEEICGNHESYVKAITNNLTELKTYTGAEMFYVKTYGNDVHIFISQPAGSVPMTDEALQLLYETLEMYRNHRCFIYVHPYLSGDSGNPLNVYGNPIFDWWGTKTTAFMNLLRHFKNTVLIHGHTHMMYECQELDPAANYTEKNGFRSKHIPSCSRPATIVNGARAYQDDKSYGCLMEVYDNCIVFNGRDFINDKWVPTGTFKINTKLVEIPAGTFTDSTGHITV